MEEADAIVRDAARKNKVEAPTVIFKEIVVRFLVLQKFDMALVNHCVEKYFLKHIRAVLCIIIDTVTMLYFFQSMPSEKKYTMLDVVKSKNIRCITLMCLILW